MKQQKRGRIAVVTPDPLRALGLVTILEEDAALAEFAEPAAMNLTEAAADMAVVALILDARPLADILLETVSRLRRDRPDIKTIVLGDVSRFEYVQSVVGAGARGYLTETAAESEIRMALGVVLDGSVWAPRKVLVNLLDTGAGPPGRAGEAISEKLTPRERDVLRLLMDGQSNREIAGRMGIDEVTVKAHLGRMLRKTGATNRIELTLKALDELSPGTRAPVAR